MVEKKVEKKLTIYQKLLEVQKSLSYVKNDARGQGYKYASGEAILGVARPKMDELGLMLFQEIIESTHEHVLWSVKSGNKQQTFSHVKFKFTWIDVETEKTIVHLFEADGFNDWDKSIGSAMTYGERYYFMKTFHIPTDDLDPNKREKVEPTKTEPTPPPPTKPDPEVTKRAEITNMLSDLCGGEIEGAKRMFKETAGVKGTAELKGAKLTKVHKEIKVMWDEFQKGVK